MNVLCVRCGKTVPPEVVQQTPPWCGNCLPAPSEPDHSPKGKTYMTRCPVHPIVQQRDCEICWEYLSTQLGIVRMENDRLRRVLRQAHACATLRPDGTCDGCIVSEVLVS